MPSEPLALSTVSPAPPAETEYDAICAAMTATARGRWFLEEYTRRNRNSDTTQVLAAIARLETTVVDNRARQATQEVRLELLEMARTIAQARADVATAVGETAHVQAAAAPVEAAPPSEIADAAERLRQIAWTVHACGIELPASEQIGQIAETLLSAEVLRNLGEQQTQKLGQVLHYLEQRIDRMLDSELAAAGTDRPAPTARQQASRDPEFDAFPLSLGDMTPANTNEAEPVAPPGPILEAKAVDAGASAAAPAPTTPDTSELTARQELTAHQEQPQEQPPDQPRMVEVAAIEIVTVAPPPTPSPPPAETAKPVQTAKPAAAEAQAETAREQVSVPAPPQAAAAQAAAAPAAAATAAPTITAPVNAAPPKAAPVQTAPVKAPPAAPSAASTVAAPTTEPPRPAASPDAIAAQVDHDLDDLTDFDAPRTTAASPQTAVVKTAVKTAPAPAAEAPQPHPVAAASEEDPADFLLEALPAAAPAAAAQPAQATLATPKLPPAPQMSTVLTAIATELLTKSNPEERARPVAISSALALVMAMSDEERIALFS